MTPTTDKLDLLIDVWDEARYIPPWPSGFTREQKRERLIEWLNSDKRPMRIICRRQEANT